MGKPIARSDNEVEETTPKPQKKAFKINEDLQSEDESDSLSDLLANFRTPQAFKEAMEKRVRLLAQAESNSDVEAPAHHQLDSDNDVEAPAHHQLDRDSDSDKFQTPKALKKASAKRSQQLDSDESEDAGKANVAQTHQGEITLNSGNFR